MKYLNIVILGLKKCQGLWILPQIHTFYATRWSCACSSCELGYFWGNWPDWSSAIYDFLMGSAISVFSNIGSSYRTASSLADSPLGLRLLNRSNFTRFPRCLLRLTASSKYSIFLFFLSKFHCDAWNSCLHWLLHSSSAIVFRSYCPNLFDFILLSKLYLNVLWHFQSFE